MNRSIATNNFYQQTKERNKTFSREAGISLNFKSWKEQLVSAGYRVNHPSPEKPFPVTLVLNLCYSYGFGLQLPKAFTISSAG